MKVTIVSGRNVFGAEASGTSAYVKGLIDRLNKEKHDVTLISTEIDRETAEMYDLNHIPIKIKKASSIRFLLKLMVKTPKLKIPEDSIIHTQRPDFTLPFILFCTKNPKVCTLHGIPEHGIKTRKNVLIWGIYSLMERWVLGRTERIIAVNQRTKEYYLKKKPKLKNKITVISVGVDNEIFKPMDKDAMRKSYGFNKDEKVILFVGRFSVEKGLDLLLLGFADLKSEMPEAKLVLLGEGPDEQKIKKLIKNNNIEDVIIMKALKHNKIPEIINCADTLVLCSLYEGMPTIVLESLACGVPVVSTEVGDVNKVVINDKTGELVQNRDSVSVKKALVNVLRNKRDYYSHNCVSVAQKYSWDEILKNIIGIYKAVSNMKKSDNMTSNELTI